MALATGQQQVAAAHPAAPRARPPGEVEEIILRQTDSSASAMEFYPQNNYLQTTGTSGNHSMQNRLNVSHWQHHLRVVYG